MCTTMTLIPTTTMAARKPETLVEYDAPYLLLKKGRVEEIYVVRELPVGNGFDGRGFTLVKDRTGDEYSTFISRNGQDDHCDCTGHLQHGVCKHTDALRHLIETGGLEHPALVRPETWD